MTSSKHLQWGPAAPGEASRREHRARLPAASRVQMPTSARRLPIPQDQGDRESSKRAKRLGSRGGQSVGPLSQGHSGLGHRR